MSSPSVGAVFDAARAGFAVWSPLLWDPIGAETVREVGPREGQRVLDACCGSGAAALPAAALVGPAGRVDAVDLAPELLAAGRRRAAAAGLSNIRFHTADIGTWQPAGGYDHVLCLFGVFFLPDMDDGGRRLLGLSGPGGSLAVTTWQRGAVERILGPFGRAAAEEHRARGTQPPVLAAAHQASARVDTEDSLARWLRAIGAARVRVRPHTIPIDLTPELAWELAIGSGTRAMLFGLDAAAVDRIHERYLTAVAYVRTVPITALIGHGRCD